MKFGFGKRLEQVNEKNVCKKLNTCPFIMKFGNTDEARSKGYQHLFCTGSLMEECARLHFYKENQAEAPEDMAPSGIYLTRERNFARNPKHKPKNARILIFSENETIGSLYCGYLRSKGYEVLHFPIPATCALVVQKSCTCPREYVCADMTLADMDMEGMSGLDLIQHQLERGCHALPQNKAVLTTGLTPEQSRDIKALGCKSLHKPFRLIDLLEWVSECEKNIPSDRKLIPLDELMGTAQN